MDRSYSKYSVSDSESFAERNTLVWGAFLVGLVLGFVAVYIVVAQPVLAQLEETQRQIVRLQSDFQPLLGARDSAWEANNLLSDLKAQQKLLTDARLTLGAIKQFRQEFADEARKLSETHQALNELTDLRNAVIDEHKLTGTASAALAEMARIQHQLVEENELVPTTRGAVADLGQVKKDFEELVRLKQRLVEILPDIQTARSAAGDLMALKDQVISGAANSEAAQAQANKLIVLKDDLAAQAGDIGDAIHGLDSLLRMKDKVIEQTPHIADAVQNLELLSDFQEEMSEQVRALAHMRQVLVDFVMLETSLGRVAKLLEPLAQIANVRRLSDQEMREAARTILGNRTTRITNKLSTDLPTSRSSDPFSDDEEKTLESVPQPIPLPLND